MYLVFNNAYLNRIMFGKIETKLAIL